LSIYYGVFKVSTLQIRVPDQIFNDIILAKSKEFGYRNMAEDGFYYEFYKNGS